MKANSTMTVITNSDRLTFDFPELGQVLVLTIEDLTPGIREAAELHGLKQKCVDAAALSRDPATGRSATAQEKYAAVSAMIERLRSGVWNDRGAGESGGALLNALVAAYPAQTRADLVEWLRWRTGKEKRALRNSEKLRPFLAIVPDGRGDELLGELGE